MNLIADEFLRFCVDGEELPGRPSDICRREVIDVLAPRPDFRGALYQLLIGLLQTTFAPKDWDGWKELWESPPSVAELDEVFARFVTAFEFDIDGPAFMQDFDFLAQGDYQDIAQLLIETPGANTVANNNDHFVHRTSSTAMCIPCAATALFTLQINAPSGGAGHRVSLRGGGPITTLRLPDLPAATLWQKLWSNVLPAAKKESLKVPPATIFPWMAPTRTSQPLGGTDTTPETAHELHPFWSMPRRIRLDWMSASPGVCTVCGGASERVVRRYRSRPHGINYTGAWMHPLTPYSLDPKQEKPPISIKGQPTGIGYRQWLGWSIGGEARRSAEVVTAFLREQPLGDQDCTLWCFGYDMDNMKARCWYDATLPLPSVAPTALPSLRDAVLRILNTATESASALRRAVGAATHPDGECDPAVPQSFWARSEPFFYSFLRGIVTDGPEDDTRVAIYSKTFENAQRNLALNLFDQWVLTVPPRDIELKRVVEARSGLEKAKWTKNSKALRAWIEANTEVVA